MQDREKKQGRRKWAKEFVSMVASSLSTKLSWNYVPQDSLSAVILGKSELITEKFDGDLGGGSVAIARCQCRARCCCMIF